jgi:phosphoglucosamine mutase
VVDHAAGAAWQVLGVALRSMGASVVSAAPRPDGVNINEGVGAVHPEAAAARCVELGAWAGLCVDGDGDRIMIIDETGAVHDGDAIVGFLAARMHEAGTLQGGEVVGTITTGMGLQAFLAERGIALHRTAVGDRHIAARLRQTGGNLGGESSGHVLTPDLCPSGDGSRVGIEVLALAATGDAALSELLGAVPRYPTGHRKVPVVAKPPLTELASLRAVLAAADAELAGCGGRQLLRYSGTEAILRVLVEGRDDALVQRWADRLADAAKNAIAEHGES